MWLSEFEQYRYEKLITEFYEKHGPPPPLL
jgi:hypothetical protein